MLSDSHIPATPVLYSQVRGRTAITSIHITGHHRQPVHFVQAKQALCTSRSDQKHFINPARTTIDLVLRHHDVKKLMTHDVIVTQIENNLIGSSPSLAGADVRDWTTRSCKTRRRTVAKKYHHFSAVRRLFSARVSTPQNHSKRSHMRQCVGMVSHKLYHIHNKTRFSCANSLFDKLAAH
jgi:acyl transferase domain-containing protein